MKPTALVIVMLAVLLPAAFAQQVVLVRAPEGILQPIGGPVQTDTMVLANAGPDRASITLAPTGPFTVSPASFALFPGATTTVTIKANAATTPFFNSGTISVQIAGMLSPLSVPMRVAAANPPAAPVKAGSSSTLVVTSGFSGFKHQGAWSISNGGATSTQGILASDMPWLVPQTDLITVGARGNTQVTFSSDPKRNGAAPLGAMKSTLSFLYLTGTATNPVDRVNATVIDISKVPVLVAQPPPPAAGETISFLPVVNDPAGVSNDLFFANRGNAALASDLSFYYTAVGASPSSSLLAPVGSLQPGAAAWFPFAPSSLFNFGIGTGTVQVRGGDPTSVALAVTRSVVPDGVNVYTTAVPVLSSDRAVAASDRLVFAGIEKSASASTDIFLQETTGNAATYTADFFDANGVHLSGVSGSLQPFGSANLRDVAPAGARSARVTNTSTNAANIAGFASVVDASTLDAWTITDPGAGSGHPADVVLPVPTGAPAGSTFNAWITNSSNASVLVTIGGLATTAPVKSRAVRRNPTSDVPDVQSLVLGSGETRQVPVAGMPFVHIGGPAGAISASGRLTTTSAARSGAYGTGVPATASALAPGAGGPESHFFRSIDSAGVAPMTLLLAEVANKPATVHVTVAFNFPAGATLSQHFERSQDYQVAAGQMLAIPDVLRAVAGGSRDSFGDVTNVVIDVQVTGGDGRVLSYVESVDPTSGDLTFTAD